MTNFAQYPAPSFSPPKKKVQHYCVHENGNFLLILSFSCHLNTFGTNLRITMSNNFTKYKLATIYYVSRCCWFYSWHFLAAFLCNYNFIVHLMWSGSSAVFFLCVFTLSTKSPMAPHYACTRSWLARHGWLSPVGMVSSGHLAYRCRSQGRRLEIKTVICIQIWKRKMQKGSVLPYSWFEI